jgi:hypothetical protein
MCGRLGYVLLLVACGLAAVPSARGSSVVEDFNDGVIDPSLWQPLGSAPGHYAREANGHLEAYNDGTENAIAGVRTRLLLPAGGRFRVQVSFNASECANESALSLSVHNANPDHTAQHVFIANADCDEREWVVGWGAAINDDAGTFQHERTSAASGVFYVTYEAGIVHLSHTGYGAENAMRTVDTHDWTDCTGVFIGLEVWADGHRLSGSGAYFDDFRLDTRDLGGTWSIFGLTSGEGPSRMAGWHWLSMEMDSAGNAWALGPVHDALDNAFYVPVLGQFSMDHRGIVTNSRIESYSGILSLDGDLIVGVGAMTPGSSDGVSGDTLQLLVRRSSRFTTGDLEGAWWVHGLISGSSSSWRPGWYWHSLDMDSDGRASATSTVHDSLGNSYYVAKWEPREPFIIDPMGAVTNPRLAAYRGTMTPDKGMIVAVVTMAPGSWEDVRGYNLQVLVRQGSAFTTDDLAGVWSVHGLTAGGTPQRAGWFRGAMDAQASGAFSASLLKSDGAAAAMTDVVQISGDGVITLAGAPSAHGVMDRDKDLIVLTMTNADDGCDLLVLTRATEGLPHDPNGAEPPVVPGTEPLIEDFETGDFSKFKWRHEGDSPWSITFSDKRSGLCSARAGEIEDDQTSVLKITRDCQAGEIGFYVKTSSESGCDKLVFEIDGQAAGEWSGYTDWKEVTHPVSTGRHTFKWAYVKDGSSSEGEDTAWLDDVVFP